MILNSAKNIFGDYNLFKIRILTVKFNIKVTSSNPTCSHLNPKVMGSNPSHGMQKKNFNIF